MPTFCRLLHPERYRAFDWDMTRDPTHLAYWLRLFETFPERIHRVLVRDGLAGERFEERWAAFVPEYAEAMRERRENLTAYEQSTIAYAGMRQALLNRYGWPDPYLRVKARENATAIGLYPQVIAEIDAAVPAERWGLLLRGIFAGNMFDLGSPRTIEMFDRGGFGWHVMLEHVPERPWHIDHADALCGVSAGAVLCRQRGHGHRAGDDSGDPRDGAIGHSRGDCGELDRGAE
jgi:hypothetical protein